MKKLKWYVMAGLFALWGVSCDSKRTDGPPVGGEIEETVEGLEPSISTDATPEPTPEEVPAKRLAPAGEVYVIRDFTVTTEHGIHGFRKGRRVRVVREDGLFLVVSDGEVEGSADRDSFTDDLDLAEQIAAEQRALQTAARAAVDEARKAEAANQAVLHEQRVANVRARRIEGLREQIRSASARI